MRVVVTGVAGAIGRHVATALSEDGNEVVGLDRDSEGLATLPAAVDCRVVDLSEQTAVEQTLAETDPDALVSCVGWYELAALEDCPPDSLRTHLEANLLAVHTPLHALLPKIRDNNGRIVVVGSMVGSVSLPYHGAYSASKTGLAGYVDSLRRELTARGVDVSLVEPGPIRTGFNEQAGTHLDEIGDSSYRTEYEPFEGYSPAATTVNSVVENVLEALESDAPRARYRVSHRARLLPWLQALLPASLFDKIVRSGLPGGLLHRLIDR